MDNNIKDHEYNLHVKVVNSRYNFTIKNFKYTETQTGDFGYDFTLLLGDIPVHNGEIYKWLYSDSKPWETTPMLQYKHTVSDGLNVISFSRIDNFYTTFEYIGDPTDYIQLAIIMKGTYIED